MPHYTLLTSPFGELAVCWALDEGTTREPARIAAVPRVVRTLPRVVRTLIPLPERDVPSRLKCGPLARFSLGHHPRVDALCDQLARYLSGEVLEPSIDLLDSSVCSAFQWRVLMAEKAIPRGQVRSYGQVAAAAGNPKAARAAGNALATNPFPLLIPCHRAVRADGSLGGYQGGPAMKRALLEIEGVRFDARGRVAGFC
jgi:methylated-DNA-[protein]-cysteine S-methyltransferase